MWELIIELEENDFIYFCYLFDSLAEVTTFIRRNEEHNSDHCIYFIEKISEESD